MTHYRDEKISHRFTVKLFNGEENDEQTNVATAMAAIDAPDVAEWAKSDMGTIAGTRWEIDGSDFAYAIFENTPGLCDRLKSEGYLIDATEFVEAT